jgi:hypothetical protein
MGLGFFVRFLSFFVRFFFCTGASGGVGEMGAFGGGGGPASYDSLMRDLEASRHRGEVY